MATRPRGRPRDPAIDDAILGAVRALLVEVGYKQLAIQAVAAHAGVAKRTLYLRYPTKASLVFDAVFGKTKQFPDPDTGNLRDDLNEAYSWAVDEFAAPEARAALPGLLAELASNPEIAQYVRSQVIEPEYARVRTALERAQARGEIHPDADLELAIDAFTGTALARATILDHPLDHAYGARLVELIISGLAPRGAEPR